MTIDEKMIAAVNVLWWSEDERLWKTALNHYWSLLSDGQTELEHRIAAINYKDIELLAVRDFYYFLYHHYFVWKYTQPNRLATTRKSLEKYLVENRMDELESIKNRLFTVDRTNVLECLSIANQIRGLGPAGASGLLSVLFPSDFATVDQFVVKALLQVNELKEYACLEKMNPQSLKPTDAVVLINIMREKANRLNACFNTDFWTPRKIDMILWSIGR